MKKLDKHPVPFDPSKDVFPTRHELPSISGAPDGAAWVWGEDDQLGRINLLTPARVLEATKRIKTGEIVPVNLPLNVPGEPIFEREVFQHEIKTLFEDFAYDDIYHMNTQSGTQWDGFRHFAHGPSQSFYNNTKGADIKGPNANEKGSIHHWAKHGIAGRGILLDFRGYAKSAGLDYNPFSTFGVGYDDLVKCGKVQGIDIRPATQGGDIQVGDILFVRTGWTESYYSKSPEERAELARLPMHTHVKDPESEPVLRYAGLKQEESMLDWLHDCYFAAAAGDSPTFEAWPTQKEYHLHEYVLALWGIPIGEMLDLEALAEKCRERNDWTFFFSSAPFNCPGGVSSYVNGNAFL